MAVRPFTTLPIRTVSPEDDEVVTDVQGFVRYLAYWKNNRLHGPKFAKHDNGMYREKSLWDSSDPERPNRLLELTIWRYNGQLPPTAE